MRHSQAAVLERGTALKNEFATEPYEVGWAGEARWFIHILDSSNRWPRLTVCSQVSPDGLTWCDWEEPAFVDAGPGLLSWPVREFGQWLRLRGAVVGEAGSLKVTVYLVLKS